MQKDCEWSDLLLLIHDSANSGFQALFSDRENEVLSKIKSIRQITKMEREA